MDAPTTTTIQTSEPASIKTGPAANEVKSFLDSWPSALKTFLQLGFAGIVVYVWMEDRYYTRQDHREEARLSREVHKESFKSLREDINTSNEHDRAVRKQTNSSIREGTAVLKEIQAEMKETHKAMLQMMKKE